MHPLKKTQRWLLKRGFSEFKPSAGFMAELAQLPENGRRGIYVHAMKDGTEFYAGLSIDVVERYQQHLQTYGTIEHSAFLPVPEEPLEPLEAAVIDDLRRIKVTLLNVLIPSELTGWALHDEDADEDGYVDGKLTEIDANQMDDWARDLSGYLDCGPSAYDPRDLPKFSKRYADLLAHPGYREDLVDFLSYFIRKVIPKADETQQVLWALNCLTETRRWDSAITLFRLTVHRPEILAIHHCKQGEDLPTNRFVFTIHAGVLDQHDLTAMMAIPGLGTPEGQFKTARFPHMQVELDSVESAWSFMAIPGVLLALRKCALKLMESGRVQPRIGQAHCLPLCQSVFARKPQPPERIAKSIPISADHARVSIGSDSAWLPEEQSELLLNELFVKAAAGDASSLGELARHSNRFHYRSNNYECMERLVAKAIEMRGTHPDVWKAMQALTHSTCAEVSSKAAYAVCLLRPVTADDRLAAVRELISDFKDSPPPVANENQELAEYLRKISLKHQGSILSGIVHTGDADAIELAGPAWRRLDSAAKLTFFEASLDLMSYAHLNFLLGLLEEAEEEPDVQASIVRVLCSPGGLDHPIIQSVVFNFGLLNGNHHHAIDPERWNYFSDFAEGHADELEEIGVKMGDPDAMQRILREWSEWDADQTNDYLPDDYLTEGGTET